MKVNQFKPEYVQHIAYHIWRIDFEVAPLLYLVSSMQFAS